MSSAVGARPPGGHYREPELTPATDQHGAGALGLTSATGLVIGSIVGTGVRVHYFGRLLAETLELPEGRAFVLDRVCTPEVLGPALAGLRRNARFMPVHAPRVRPPAGPRPVPTGAMWH